MRPITFSLPDTSMIVNTGGSDLPLMSRMRKCNCDSSSFKVFIGRIGKKGVKPQRFHYDHTHFNEFGTRKIAQIVLGEIKTFHPELVDRMVKR